MNRTLKKISAIGLSVTTAVWLSGAVMIMPALATTIDDLQAQITLLLAQIKTLQDQLKVQQPATSSYNFTRSLTVGSKGEDVSALQSILISAGYLKIDKPTAYFGSLTKAALAKYQAAKSISPAVGYFGPKTRAYVASVTVAPITTFPAGCTSAVGFSPTTGLSCAATTTFPAGCTSAVGFSPTTGLSCAATTTTPGAPVAPISGLSVSLAADNPAAGVLISSVSSAAARVPVLTLDFTAGTAGGMTITGIKFHKSGVLSDSSISSAYLVESGKVLTQYSSLSGGVVNFDGLSLNVDAGKTRKIIFAIDPSTGLSAGNTVAFTLSSVSDVTVSSGAVSGSFPLNGNVFTVTSVTRPDIAALEIVSSSVGNSVYAGTQNVLVSQWTATATNSPVNLTSVNFKVIGSATKTDIKNVVLKINGTQVGSTLTSVGSDGSTYFDLSAAPAKLNTGSSNIQVYADIMGSPSFNFALELLNSYDVYAVDTQYNVPVGVTITGGSGVTITINQGQITVTADTNTPTGNIAKGGSGTALAKFDIYAAGEALKVKFLTFKLTFTGSTTTISTMLKNVALVDDSGAQVGTTINTPPTPNSCDNNGLSVTAGYDATGAIYYDCFGTSASPINYIVPANTTRVLTLKADIQSGATFTTVTAALTGNSSNLQGQTSSGTASSGSASGAALTLALYPLTVDKNNAVGTMTYAKGATAAKIGSYVLTASSAEGINVSNFTVTMASSSANFQNLLAKVGDTQIGTTKATLGGSDVVTFSGNLSVPTGGTTIVNIYADILSSASTATYTTLTTLTSCTGTGASTYSSVSCSPTSVAGQDLTVSSGSTLTVSLDSNSAPNKQVIMGVKDNSLATFRFVDTANLEPIKITDLVVYDLVSTDGGTTSTVKASFSGLTFYNGTAAIGTASLVDGVVADTYKASFHLATPVTIPQNGSVSLELKGDVASYSSNGATDNKIHIFKFDAVGNITALGVSSNQSVTPTLSSATGNQITVLRGKLTLTGATLGSTSGRVRTAVDDIGTLTFTAAAGGYDVTVNTVTLKLQGQAVSSGTAAFNVDLIDSNTGSDWSGLSAQSCNPATGNSCSVSFAFSTIPTITAGSSKTVKVRVDSSSFYDAASTAESLSTLVSAYDKVNWGDGTTTGGLYLQPTDVPIVVSSVSY